LTLATLETGGIVAVRRHGHGRAAWRGREWRTACRLAVALHARADWDLAIRYAKGIMTVQQLTEQLKQCPNKRAKVQLLGSGSIRSIVAVGLVEAGKSSVSVLRLVGDDADGGYVEDPARAE
jgi:hypothetical protein